MTLDPEALSVLRAALLATAAAFAITKISRHCSAEGLRRRLRGVETELFEFARLGHIGFRDPAYLLLRNSLRSIVWASQDFSLTRAALAVLQGHGLWRSGNLQQHTQAWEEALDKVADLHSKRTIAEMHRRMLRTVQGYLALGAIPFAAWLYQRVSPILADPKGRPAPMGRVRLLEAYSCALSAPPPH